MPPVPDSLSILKISRTQADAVLEVYRQCEDFLALGPAPEASMEMVLKDIQEAEAESGVFCGIFSGNEMIGVVSYVPSHFEFRPVDAFVLLLMITPSYRRQGLGGEIVNRIEKEICAHARIRAIVCGVQTNNPDAIRFWQKMGYEIFRGPELRPDKTTIYRLRKDIDKGGRSSG